MTFISYAQNFEDITLWRALQSFTGGFYIDVGANDPTIDSVTKAFYERGWRGINIEPSPYFYPRLCAERPRDINLPVAVSDRAGELTFYDAGISGRSTVDAETAVDLDNSGAQLLQRTIPTQTLTAICAQHVQGDIHFLKIDVEGHEQAVLRGMDFQRWRPWIVVIENPFNVEPVWAPLLVDADYEFVHYDGINRYYLAAEHKNLTGALAVSPNFLDDFQLRYGHHFSYPVAELEAKIASECQRADIAEARLAALGYGVYPYISLLRRAVGKILRRIKA